MNQHAARLIPMEGARNLRDLGGYPAGNGVTRSGVFYRGDSTAGLTAGDVARLRGLDVRLVLDLRSAMEAERAPSRLNIPGMEYVNIPMLDQVNSGGISFPRSMGELYERLLETGGGHYRDIFTRMALCGGACLFHCTAGKDRTGVVAMLLLKLAGVPDEAVIDDYTATDLYMEGAGREQLRRFAEKGVEIPAHVLRADRENIVHALGRLRERFGGAERYLLDCGVAPARLTAIRGRFLEAVRGRSGN